MNDTREELRQLITDVVTGDYNQLENLDFDEEYWRNMAKEQSDGDAINISVTVDQWLYMLDVARNHTGRA